MQLTRPILALRISDDTGMPCAQIPPRYVWDLVAYLSSERVRVTYSFVHRAECYSVSFPRTDLESAQRILNEWASAEEVLVVPEYSHSGH